MNQNILIGVGVAIVSAVFGFAVWMRSLDDDPQRWHVILWEASRLDQTNDYFVAPDGFGEIKIDRISKVYPIGARSLLWQFDAIAQNQGAKVIGGKVDDLRITYVVRSRLFAFPDYITVRAIKSGDGATLAIWARSRWGFLDQGTNRRRINRWLARLDKTKK